MEGITVKRKGEVAKVGMEGEGGIEGLINGIGEGDGVRRSKKEGLPTRKR